MGKVQLLFRASAPPFQPAARQQPLLTHSTHPAYPTVTTTVGGLRLLRSSSERVGTLGAQLFRAATLAPAEESSPVPGLAMWLGRMGLSRLIAPARRWAESQGACELEEVLENIDDFIAYLKLGETEERHLQENAREAGDAVKQLLAAGEPLRSVSALQKSVSVPVAGTAAAGRAWFQPAPAAAAPMQAIASYSSPAGFAYSLGRTQTELSDEKEATAQRAADQSDAHSFGIQPEMLNANRERKIFANRPAWQRLRYATPPKQRWRVDGEILRKRIPTASKLKAVENARTEAVAQLDASWGDDQETTEKKQTGGRSRPSEFDQLRQSFMEAHGENIRQELGPGYKLEPANVSEQVQKKFLQTCNMQQPVPNFGYHGTRSTNIPSILSKGLLVPGEKSGIGVANGSAHGVGIYTGMPGQSWLSKGFSDSPNLLVVGVVDPSATPYPQHTAAPPPAAPLPPRTGGPGGHRNHHRPLPGSVTSTAAVPPPVYDITQQRSSEALTVVGAARVIFKEEHVAPLFIAQPTSSAETFHPESRMDAYRAPNNCNKAQSTTRAGARQVFVKEAGESMWAPPEEMRGWKEIHMKRKIVAKERDQQRAYLRSVKQSALES